MLNLGIKVRQCGVATRGHAVNLDCGCYPADAKTQGEPAAF
jgi:hypothetical protein